MREVLGGVFEGHPILGYLPSRFGDAWMCQFVHDHESEPSSALPSAFHDQRCMALDLYTLVGLFESCPLLEWYTSKLVQGQASAVS